MAKRKLSLAELMGSKAAGHATQSGGTWLSAASRSSQ